MHAHETTTPSTTMSLLDYTMITFDNMVDRGLDDLENSNNSIIQFMNRRVDEIQEEMKKSTEEFYLMQFASMSVMLPIVGITLFYVRRLANINRNACNGWAIVPYELYD